MLHKIKYILFFLAIGSTLICTSCRKEREHDKDLKPATDTDTNSISDNYCTLTATEYHYPNAKGYVKDNNSKKYYWTLGEDVAIDGDIYAISKLKNAYTAIVELDEALGKGEHFVCYPTNVVMERGNNAQFLIEKTLQYKTTTADDEEHQLLQVPLVGHSSTNEFRLTHLSTLGEIIINNNSGKDIAISNITLYSSNSCLSGNINAKYSNGNWNIGYESLRQSDSIRQLVFPSPHPLHNKKQHFYLPLLPSHSIQDLHVDLLLLIDGIRQTYSAVYPMISGLENGNLITLANITINSGDCSISDGNINYTQQGNGQSTPADPIRIGNANEWKQAMDTLATSSNAYFILDQSFSITSGYFVERFCGHLDGNGYTISLTDAPLIATLDGGSISNLSTTGEITEISQGMTRTDRVNDNPYAYLGIIASEIINHGNINRCTVHTNVNGSNYNDSIFLGGIAGAVYDGTIDGCIYSGNVTATIDWVGGIAGSVKSNGLIINCGNHGNFSYPREDNYLSFGGIGHQVYGKVLNCYAISNTSAYTCGGIAIQVFATGRVKNCYSYDSLYSVLGCRAGICIKNEGTIDHCYYARTNENASLDNSPTSRLSNCYELINECTIGDDGIEGTNSLKDALNKQVPYIDNAWQWEKNGVFVLPHPPSQSAK